MNRKYSHKEYHAQLARTNKENLQEIDQSYDELLQVLLQFDPIKLLSQMQLTYLLTPENVFHGEDSEQESWLRKIEILTGIYLSRAYPKETKSFVDGKDLEIVESALERYLKSITTDLLTSGSLVENEEDREIESILKHAKLFSFYVRGESYQHQLKDIFVDVYTAHDKWFSESYGFTIKQALEISESIINEYNDRINKEKDGCYEKAKSDLEQFKQKGQKIGDEKDFLRNAAAFHFFGESDRIFIFTLEQLSQFSGFPEKVCQSFLSRLSQKFEYKNPRFPHTFEKAITAPWDYNTLYERPIIEHNGVYYVPLLTLFYEVLYHTFYYDLIGDTQYWDSGGSKTYANSLEEKTSEYLGRIFPKECIFLNPEYPDGNELCDVLVLFDRYVLIFQDKAKRMRYDSIIGTDIEKIKEDLSKGIRSAFDQAINAKNYLESEGPVIVKTKSGDIVIDGSQISQVFPISVTLDGYQNFTTRFENTNSILKVFEPSKYPWSVSLSDLGTITELIETPAQFIHYLIRRLTVEKTKFQLYADEIDLLGLYLSRGLYFENGEFDKYTGASFSGFSAEIDKFLFEQHETNLNPVKPHPVSPDGFEDFIIAVDDLNTPYRTDCIIRLLDLSFEGREGLIKAVESLKKNVVSGKSLESFSFTINDRPLGFSFIGMDTEENPQRLYQQVFSFATMKKYTTKCKEWVAFGWDKKSDKLVDLALFLSYEWMEDEVIEEIAKERLKIGRQVKF